jgi:hypothetical protein
MFVSLLSILFLAWEPSTLLGSLLASPHQPKSLWPTCRPSLLNWHPWCQFFPLCSLFACFQMFFHICGLRGLVFTKLASNLLYPSTDVIA